MYQHPPFNYKHFKKKFLKTSGNPLIKNLLLLLVVLVAISFYTGSFSLEKIGHQAEAIAREVAVFFQPQKVEELPKPEENYISKIPYEQAVIDAVQSASPSVVSIVISKNMPVYEQEFISPFGEDFGGLGFEIPQYVQKGTKYQEIGAGSGFIVSQDGLVLTNKHVVLDKAADYTVVTNGGSKYNAKVVALDPVQDLAIIKIQTDASKNPGQAEKFPSIKLGDSNGVRIGQGVIAIGNALGQFTNTVSVGVVSGLKRTVSASNQSGSFSETLEGIIQTDAAINQGNSGGPLLNLRGEVIGVSVATAQGAQSIGFAIPINIAKRDIQQIIATNKITYAFLGVRYVLVDDKVKKEHKLTVDYGAYVKRGDNGEAAITANSPAKTAGLKEKDVILTFNGEKVTKDNSLASIIAKYNPGDKVTLKVLRAGEEIDIEVTLTERK